ncbi:MAG: tetratricopeptide repeat protein [Planctomycetota bacterium]
MKGVGTIFALLPLVVGAAAAPAAEEAAATAAGRPHGGPLLSVYHEPLEGHDAGRLYEPTARLLEAARTMPDRIALPEPRPVPLPPPKEQPEPAEPVEIPEPPEEEWKPVVDRPVVEEAELAHIYYMAERYAEAALLYGRLYQKNPNDRHTAIMLLLSHRNAGHKEKTRELLEDFRAEKSAAEWTNWMEQMEELAKPLSGEPQ